MTKTTPERRYALTKLDRGDYLLPANDGTTIWRICQDDYPVDDQGLRMETRWAAYRWRIAWRRPEDVDDIDDWGNWDQWVAGCRTRAEAIGEALRVGGDR
jgi:hypothetical protein